MDSDKTEDIALDKLFAAAKSEMPSAPDAFLARLKADADTSLPKPTSLATTPSKPSVLENLKGWFAVSGLSGAAALGVWIGFIMPEVVTTISPLSQDVVELSTYLPGADLSVLSE